MLKSKNRILIILGTFSIILGISLLGYQIYKHYQNKYLNQKLIEEFFDNNKEVGEMTSNIKNTNNSNSDTIFSTSSNHYIMVLEIPKIKLKKGIYKINSKYNSVEYGVEILKQSSMPNLEKGNLILASHNGSSKVSYFKNLHKLSNNDLLYIYYKNIKYIYEIVNIYEVFKTGTAHIYKDDSKMTITLITCKKNAKKQLIFIGNLVRKEKY